MSSKPRLYWREETREGFHEDESCWAVQIGNVSCGFESWAEAFRYAYLSVAAAEFMQ